MLGMCLFFWSLLCDFRTISVQFFPTSVLIERLCYADLSHIQLLWHESNSQPTITMNHLHEVHNVKRETPMFTMW